MQTLTVDGVTYAFDIPTMLQSASPRKLAMFVEALRAFIADNQAQGRLLNVRVQLISAFRLAAVKEAVVAGGRAHVTRRLVAPTPSRLKPHNMTRHSPVRHHPRRSNGAAAGLQSPVAVAVRAAAGIAALLRHLRQRLLPPAVAMLLR